jgi:DNA-binding ferritin-like protein
MIELAVKLRYMQFYAHNAHNACQGATFYSDHEELGSLYGTYEGFYDGVIERMLGLGQTVDLIKVQIEAVKMLEGAATPTTFTGAFSTILSCEEELSKLIEEANADASLGTQNFLQGIADTSEVRQYKLKKYLSKSSESKTADAALEAKIEEKEATDKNKNITVKLLTSKK